MSHNYQYFNLKDLLKTLFHLLLNLIISTFLPFLGFLRINECFHYFYFEDK
jgi:hypothetical protein